jgi:hypothetical protein
MQGLHLAVRVHAANPLHHLWNNHGTWWTHFTVHTPDQRKRRVRRSLRTSDLTVAIARRDALLSALASSWSDAEGGAV